MQWVIQFIVRHRNLASLFLTGLLSMWMLGSNAEKQQRIARGLTLSVFYPFQFTFQEITRARDIFAENRRLREELAQLRTSVSMLSEEAAENRRLRSLVGFADSFSCKLVPCRVIAREPSPLYRSLVISAGRKQGVSLYMPVVTKDGVVGRVVHVLSNLSLVQLLKDPSARTSVISVKSRSVGILETENARTFFIKYRTAEAVAAGDTIVTSGLGGIYPKGLLVGIVTKVDEGRDPLFKRVVIALHVDFDHLEELFVMQISPQWSAQRNALDSIEFRE